MNTNSGTNFGFHFFFQICSANFEIKPKKGFPNLVTKFGKRNKFEKFGNLFCLLWKIVFQKFHFYSNFSRIKIGNEQYLEIKFCKIGNKIEIKIETINGKEKKHRRLLIKNIT